MTLRKSILRQIKEKKFQYVGVIVLLLVSIMLYVSMSMAISTLDNRNNEFKEENHQEDFHFILAEDIESTQLTKWEETYNLQLEERMYADVTFETDTTLRLFTQTEKVNEPYISEGDPPLGEGEIALSPVFAEANNVKVGDSISIKDTALKVSGLVYLPDYIYVLKREDDLFNDPNSFGIGITNQSTMKLLSNNITTHYIGDDATHKEIDAFKKDVSSNYSLLKWLDASDNPRIQFVESEIESSSAMITTLPLFILALSVMMALMIMKRQLETQRKEIGTLMALGYRKNELIRHYLTQAAFIGMVGSVLGIVIGAAMSVPFTNLYSNYYNLPSISYFDWDLKVLVIGFVIPNIVLLIMSFYVISKPLKQSPLQLLTPKDMSTGKKSAIEKLPFFRKGSFISRFRLRLMIRSKTRAVYIFFGVMFSTILLIFGFITYNSMDNLMETTYKDVFQYDYGIYYKSLQNEETNENVTPFTTSEIIVEKVNGKQSDLDQKGTIYGIPPETSQINLLNQEETSLNNLTSEGFIISKPLATILGIEKGDTITVSNNFNESTLTKEVQGVSNIYIGNSLYYELPKVNEFLGYPSDVYTAKWSDVKPDDSKSIMFVEDKQEAMKNFESTSALTRNSVVGMAVFAVVIGVIVLTLITNLIVEENSPSISLLKVMGYKDNEVSKLILNVYTPIVFASYFLSIPIAYVSIDQLMKSLVSETGFSLPINLSFFSIIIGFIIIIITYYVSLFFSKRKLKRISLQEALKKQQD